jgi:hypothetical protein
MVLYDALHEIEKLREDACIGGCVHVCEQISAVYRESGLQNAIYGKRARGERQSGS